MAKGDVTRALSAAPLRERSRGTDAAPLSPMPLSDAHWRSIVELGLGASAPRCEALVARIAARHPEHERADAVARSMLLGAILGGAPSGLAASLPRALTLALLEQRAALCRAVMLRACLERLEDPRAFERPEWARRALLAGETPGELARRVASRIALRFGALRGTRRATRLLGARASSMCGAAAGAIWNGLEHARLTERVLAERERRGAARRGVVIALPLGREISTTRGR